MADYTTQLDCLRTFLLKVHTVATTKHINEISSLENIVDASFQKMFINHPEMMGVNGNFYTKRYKIEIQETSEANLETSIDNILIGIDKFNKRTAITGFAYGSAPTMCHMKYVNSNEAEHNKSIWKCEIWLDIKWSTN